MSTRRTKVSIPVVAGQGDILEFDGEYWVIEQTTTGTHYMTIRRTEDDFVRSFANNGDFQDWVGFREEFGLVRADSPRSQELGFETKEVDAAAEAVISAEEGGSGTATRPGNDGEQDDDDEEQAYEETDEPGTMAFDPSELTVEQMRTAVSALQDPDAVRAIMESEQEGDDRDSAIEVLEGRLDELEQAEEAEA